MIKRALPVAGLLLLAAGLGSCKSEPKPRNLRPDRVRESAVEWLAADVACSGRITRAQWLLCDDAGLRDLHVRLAGQWADARRGATRQELLVMAQQQRALVAERNACENAGCVETAYLRYLDPPPAPAATPRPKPVSRPRRAPRPTLAVWRAHDDAPGCAAAIGEAGAHRLAEQCGAVNPGAPGLCAPRRSCEALHRHIAQGCDATYRKPGFCPKI